MKQILPITLKKTLHSFTHACKTHKKLLLLLFVLQVIYIAIISYINVTYHLVIAQEMNAILTPLQTANYDPELIQAGIPFLQDIAQFYEHYQNLLSSLQKLVFYQVLVFLVLGVFMWAVTHLLFVRRTVVGLFQHYVQLLLRAVIFIVPTFFVSGVLLNTTFDQLLLGGESLSLVYAALGVFAVGIYFLLVGLAIENGGIWSSIRAAFVFGIKKAHYLIPTLLAILGAIVGLAYLGYLMVESPLWLLSIVIILFVSVFVLGRVLLVALVREFT